MKVRFITLLNGMMQVGQDLGIEMLNQVLLDNGYDSETSSFFYKNKMTYSTPVEYARYVCEVGELPLLLTLIDNYQNKRPLRENIEEAIQVEFEMKPPEVFDELDNHIESLEINDGDVFCFGTTYISFVPMVYYALKVLSINKNVKIVFGGYHVTLSKFCRDIILRLKIADAVVINDGSSVILDVIKGNLSGLVNGKFVKNARLPEYNRSKLELCDGWITTISSFGCPNSCKFCASGREWLGFDINYVHDYLLRVKEVYPDIKYYFADDNINMSIPRFNQIADMLVDLGRPWRAFANPIHVTAEIAKKLQVLKCESVYLGAEGFSNDILTKLGKPNLNVAMVKSGISQFASHGIPVSVGLIVGMPGESDETFSKSDAACRELIAKFGHPRVHDGGLVDLIPTAFKIFPNSDHYWRPGHYGIQFGYWEDKYINQIPEISDIVAQIPKTFSVEGTTFEWTREKVMQIRGEYGIPTK